MSRISKDSRDELKALDDIAGWITDEEARALIADSEEVDQLREVAASNKWFDLFNMLVETIDGELEKRGLGVNILWGFSDNEPTVRCEISERLEEDLHG